uniref:Uncharacterized protein n=1 Tax=Meloidogyne javanica TaxID=6303 RepID=A0A915LWB4_MELJA
MFLRFLDKLLGECTSAELIKLVVVSLDYFPSLPRLDAEDGYYSRFLLENVLISSKNIVTILCPKDVLIEMREQLLRAKLETLGDAGILLEVFLFDADLDTMEVDKSKLLLEIASNSLNKWNDYFYIHYNEIIAEQIRRALINNDGTNFFCFKRSKNGDFARASGQLPTSVSTHKKQRVFPPPHLYGHLARSKVGQDLLKNRNIIGKLEGIICNFLQKGICVDQIDQVKGSLFALAQILANLPSFSNSLDSFFNNYNSTSKYFYTKQDSNSEEFCEKGAANILEEKEKHKITEKENNDLIDYRKFLAKIDNLDRQTEYYKEINNFNNFGHNIFNEKEKEKNEEKEKTEKEIRQLIYQLATQFSNTEITIKLLRIYKEQPEIFENRCLFSDVIKFISDSKIISFGGRRLLYQLFWKALSN